jgi:alginate O-acetyltransferase complex protein AlgI
MLFNSYDFILFFLPITLGAFFALARWSHRAAAAWLALASLFFYGWWNPQFVVLLVGSILFNYACGYALSRTRGSSRAKPILTTAVAVNLVLLGYWKYTNFFIVTLNALTGHYLNVAEIVLPLGISFFTFTQIAFLVDAYRGIAAEYNMVHYLLFVSYFPHLIAGPIIHHKSVMPQFAADETYRAQSWNFATGMLMFGIGLAKKVLLADSFAEYSSPIFNGAHAGLQPNVVVAWTGALAYTGQIYFDFSGYSDMAIGISRMIGVELPLNFNSPYKSVNIIEFWRRWHMSLSSFLRDYLYIPLGGNRHGTLRRQANLITTMLLGGLWHGASWTFVIWGGLHGIFLVMNHGWQGLVQRADFGARIDTPMGRALARILTMVCVIVGWVFFRAETFESAVRVLQGMISLDPVFSGKTFGVSFAELYKGYLVPPDSFTYVVSLLGLGLLIAGFLPNTQELLKRVPLDSDPTRYGTIGAMTFLIFLLAAISASRGVSEFIYYNF